MNTQKQIHVKLIAVAMFLMGALHVTQAQEQKLVNQESSLKVFGTSSLHDWHVDAEEQSGTLTIKDKETGAIGTCDIKVVAESLKSGKSAMDKNTYKALKTDKYKAVTFQLVQVEQVTPKGSGVFVVSTKGNLSIAGTKKLVPLTFTMTITGSKTTLEGEKTFNMTDFNIEPPKALFGTITTGDQITVKFTTVFK